MKPDHPHSLRRTSGSVARFITRRYRRLRRVGSGIQVLAIGAVLLVCSGRIRGPEPDQLAAFAVHWVQQALHQVLSRGWVHPTVASGTVLAATFIAFSAIVFGLAALVRRIPSFIGFLVLAEFHRRQGHKLSAVELLLGISIPIAMMLALVCTTALSLYAAVYFVLAYGYIHASTDPVRLDGILNWYVRIRTGVDTSLEADDDDEPDEVEEE